MIMIGCILHLAAVWVVVVGRIVGHCLGQGHTGLQASSGEWLRDGSKKV